MVCKRECEEANELMEEISKGIVKTKRETLMEIMVMTFGGVELDEDKRSFLSLGPDFATYEDFLRKRTEVDFLIAATKMRWGKMERPA